MPRLFVIVCVGGRGRRHGEQDLGGQAGIVVCGFRDSYVAVLAVARPGRRAHTRGARTLLRASLVCVRRVVRVFLKDSSSGQEYQK